LFIKKIFKNIENNNHKLQEYNHFLAHELKTPIAVVQSNLDVLEY
jgi:signal transduction histidine kinase